MTVIAAPRLTSPHQMPTLDDALPLIARGADARDRDPAPSFPELAFDLLRATGATAWNAVGGSARPPATDELTLVRSVARADGSVGRIFDGHLNAVERLAVQAPAVLADAELRAVRQGRLLAGVWGGDPQPPEGSPARLRRATRRDGHEVITGVKTFCSGAGGLDRALVLARTPEDGPPVAVWIDLSDRERVEIDTSWYRSSGLRASVSHRVVFHDAPVLARFGQPGAIAVQPWFARDALRTAASWAGMADAAAEAALGALAERPATSALDELAAGRMIAERATIDAWIACAATAMDAGAGALESVALNARAAIAGAAERLLADAAHACGSHPFATGNRLDRARRDLGVFLLQHRLDPLLAHAGAAALQEPMSDPMTAADFERRYQSDPDPWGYGTSEYEHDKYAATLAACGAGPFASALELGASIGSFSALLAERCARLVTLDFSPTAVDIARSRLASHRHVDVRLAQIPAAIPAGPFDLVVASEILYYLDAPKLAGTLAVLQRSLAAGGVFVCVHWRPDGPERPFDAATVHGLVRGLPWLSSTESGGTDDYLLDVLVKR